MTLTTPARYRTGWLVDPEIADIFRALIASLRAAATAYVNATWAAEHPHATIPPSRIRHTWRTL